MDFNYSINHSIPGRIRLTIPALANNEEHPFIKEMFESINGIKNVRIVPIIQSMVIEYNTSVLNSNQILRYVRVFFHQFKTGLQFSSKTIQKDMKNNLLRSGISGILLVIALLRKNTVMRPDALDYLATISTSYTVLSHGENKLSHPDVITGMISMISLGSDHILQIAMVSWIVNLVELFNDWKRNSKLLYQ